MRKNLLFFLMAMLLPCLAWADNKAIQKTIPASYYQLQDNRLVVSANAAGITLPQTAGNSYAVAQWINPTSVNYSYGGVLMDYGTYEHMNFNGNWCLSVDKDAVLKINGHGSDNHGVGGVGSLGVTINFNEWNYLLSQYDAETKTMSVYINGEKAFSKTFDYDVYYPWSDGSFHFGGFGLAALIDEVHVFNKALTDDEVKQAYKNPTKMASLTALYTLDEETPTGKFANSAANAAEGTEATWVLYKGSSYWGDGIVTGSESAASPTLVDGRAASSYTFVVPSSDPEHLSLVMYIIDGNIYSSLFQPGEEVSVEPGTEVTVNATVAAGFVVAALTVDGIEVDLTYEDDEVTGKFIINSNLDENSIVWTVTRTPYEITIEHPENAVITVKNGDAVVESGDMIPAGTELTLSAVCTDGYSVSSYLLNGQPVEGTTVEVPEEAFTISANVATIDYCERTDKVSRTDRYVTSLNVNGTTIAGPGNASNHNLYVDRTSSVVTVDAGDVVNITTTGGGEWTHTYYYVDFDKNGWNVDENSLELNGDLVWFNRYRLSKDDDFVDCEGNIYYKDQNGGATVVN
ncbi:MAG: LamG domain-containing protein [Paramuribaculum sp.]|nr:LamG domain-containing protein [Paramuribaculum sp.]